MSVLPIRLLLPRLDKVKASGKDKWMACCPAHDDGSPSLAIKENTDGSLLIYCFAGCHSDDITAAIGLKMSDLFLPANDFDRRAYAKRKAAEEARIVSSDDHLFLEIAKAALANGEILGERDQELLAATLHRSNN